MAGTSAVRAGGGGDQSGTVRAGGTRLHYEQRGSGPPILCVHGAGSSSELWMPAVSVLAGHGRVIAYDRRAYGRSERVEPLPPTPVERHSEDAAELLEALDAAPAVIIGRSYGGQVAIDLALRRPELVRAIVLLEGVPESFDAEAGAWLRDLVSRTLAAAGGEPGTIARTLFAEVLGEEGWEGLPEEVRRVFVANEPAMVADFSGKYLLDVEPEALGSIDKPALIVTAADSPDAFRRANLRAARSMPSARTAVVAGSHMIDPASPPVLEFLRDVLGRPG